MPIFIIRHLDRDMSNANYDVSLNEQGLLKSPILADTLDKIVEFYHSVYPDMPIEIFSSPYLRCIQTITPFALRNSIPIKIDSNLIESFDFMMFRRGPSSYLTETYKLPGIDNSYKFDDKLFKEKMRNLTIKEMLRKPEKFDAEKFAKLTNNGDENIIKNAKEDNVTEKIDFNRRSVCKRLHDLQTRINNEYDPNNRLIFLISHQPVINSHRYLYTNINTPIPFGTIFPFILEQDIIYNSDKFEHFVSYYYNFGGIKYNHRDFDAIYHLLKN